jgi:hypothetical protein
MAPEGKAASARSRGDRGEVPAPPQTQRAQPDLIRQPRSSGSIYRVSGRCSRLPPVASSARREAQRHQPSRHCHAAHRARTSPRVRRRCCARRPPRALCAAPRLAHQRRRVHYSAARFAPCMSMARPNRKGRHPYRRLTPRLKKRGRPLDVALALRHNAQGPASTAHAATRSSRGELGRPRTLGLWSVRLSTGRSCTPKGGRARVYPVPREGLARPARGERA